MIYMTLNSFPASLEVDGKGYGTYSVPKDSYMPARILLVDQLKGTSKSFRLEGFDLMAMYDVDKSMVHRSNRIVLLRINYYSQ